MTPWTILNSRKAMKVRRNRVTMFNSSRKWKDWINFLPTWGGNKEIFRFTRILDFHIFISMKLWGAFFFYVQLWWDLTQNKTFYYFRNVTKKREKRFCLEENKVHSPKPYKGKCVWMWVHFNFFLTVRLVMAKNYCSDCGNMQLWGHHLQFVKAGFFYFCFPWKMV